MLPTLLSERPSMAGVESSERPGERGTGLRADVGENAGDSGGVTVRSEDGVATRRSAAMSGGERSDPGLPLVNDGGDMDGDSIRRSSSFSFATLVRYVLSRKDALLENPCERPGSARPRSMTEDEPLCGLQMGDDGKESIDSAGPGERCDDA
jgi:hypothetical protein